MPQCQLFLVTLWPFLIWQCKVVSPKPDFLYSLTLSQYWGVLGTSGEQPEPALLDLLPFPSPPFPSHSHKPPVCHQPRIYLRTLVLFCCSCLLCCCCLSGLSLTAVPPQLCTPVSGDVSALLLWALQVFPVFCWDLIFPRKQANNAFQPDSGVTGERQWDYADKLSSP